MATQSQLRWSQLRVGLTVIASVVVLVALIFLMSNSEGLFTKTVTLYTYVGNAGGLRVGAPVSLQGVKVGSVKEIRMVSGHGTAPVRVTLQVAMSDNARGFIKKDTQAQLSTAGMLGETFVDLDSAFCQNMADASNGDTLPSREQPDIQDVVRSSQTTLQNVDALLHRADRIMGAVENGQGSIGKLINDKQLYVNLNGSIAQLNGILTDLNQGKGTMGKILKDEEMYRKLNVSIDQLNQTVSAINRGEGSAGKFIKDPSLYDNANQTLAKANQLMDSLNNSKGVLGKLTKDPEMARKIDETVTNLNTITGRMARGEGSAGKFLTDPAFYNDTDALLKNSSDLVQAIRQNPKKYLTIQLKIF